MAEGSLRQAVGPAAQGVRTRATWPRCSRRSAAPSTFAPHRTALRSGPWRVSAADRGAPPLRLALHAALAHRADRPPCAGASLRARRRQRLAGAGAVSKVFDPACGSGAFLVEACRHIGRRLVKAWAAHGREAEEIPTTRTKSFTPAASSRNAASTAWTRTRWPSIWPSSRCGWRRFAKDHPFTFLDHAFKCGDSLVGLSRGQIEAFHWKPPRQTDLFRGAIRNSPFQCHCSASGNSAGRNYRLPPPD